jgi:predicted transcriptional regulator
MKRTTIFADDTLLNEIKYLAQQEDRSVADLIREAMVQYLEQKRKPAQQLSFIAFGASQQSDIAERSEELLWQKPSH